MGTEDRGRSWSSNVLPILTAHTCPKEIQSCISTTRPVITLIGCNAVGRASRFFGR